MSKGMEILQKETIKQPDQEENGEGYIYRDDHVSDDYYGHSGDFQEPNKHSGRNVKIDGRGNTRNMVVEGGGQCQLRTQRRGIDFMCLTCNDSSSDEGDSLLLSEHSRALFSNMKNKMRLSKNKSVSDVKKKKIDLTDVNPLRLPQNDPMGARGEWQTLEDVVVGIPALLDLRTALLKHGSYVLALFISSLYSPPPLPFHEERLEGKR